MIFDIISKEKIRSDNEYTGSRTRISVRFFQIKGKILVGTFFVVTLLATMALAGCGQLTGAMTKEQGAVEVSADTQGDDAQDNGMQDSDGQAGKVQSDGVRDSDEQVGNVQGDGVQDSDAQEGKVQGDGMRGSDEQANGAQSDGAQAESAEAGSSQYDGVRDRSAQVSGAQYVVQSSGEIDTAVSTASQRETMDKKTIDTVEMFTNRDKEVGYNEDKCVVIQLADGSTTCDSDHVMLTGNTVTITGEGDYLLRGELADGMVVVDTVDTAKVRLILDGVKINNADSAAVYVKQADKVFVTTVVGTKNILSNGGSYAGVADEPISAAIYSKEDLTLNGCGELSITAAAGSGIRSNDDLVIASGTYVVEAQEHGLYGKDSVRILDAEIHIEAARDGIFSEASTDVTKGFVYISGGDFEIKAAQEAVCGDVKLTIKGGSFAVKTDGRGGINHSCES